MWKLTEFTSKTKKFPDEKNGSFLNKKRSNPKYTKEQANRKNAQILYDDIKSADAESQKPTTNVKDRDPLNIFGY